MPEKTPKKYHFIAGLPRSGSTLFCNILAQNPRFHATATSGVMDIMFNIRNIWDNLIEFKANPNEEAKLRVLRGILENFYANIDKPIIFDKCRGWTSLLEMAEATIGKKAKVLVPVRDVRDVIASFEKLWRKNSATSQTSGEGQAYFQFPIDGVPALSLPVREIFACIAQSDKRLFIDSMPQHVAVALGKKSVVAWVGNPPEVFGYDFHKNIVCKTSLSHRHYPRSYTDRYDITGAIDECPFDTNELFNDTDLVKEILRD